MYVVLPFAINKVYAQEGCMSDFDNMRQNMVMVNVGWVSEKEFKMYKLRRLKLPNPENFQVINNTRGDAQYRFVGIILWVERGCKFIGSELYYIDMLG